MAIPLKKYRLKHFILPKWLDHALKYLKYVLLLFIVIGVWIFALTIDPSLNPWGIFGMLSSGNLSLIAKAIPTVGFVILVAIMIASMFIERFFCRYLCPLGAIFALVSGKRLYKIRLNKHTCVHCNLCTKKCAMGIDVAEADQVSSGECIDCMQCVSACPRQCLCTVPTPAVAGTTAALALYGVVAVSKIAAPDTSLSATFASEEGQRGNYTDGVYFGKGMGFSGEIEVQVNVVNGRISEIKVLSYKDDDEFFNKAASTVIRAILSKQSVEVDAVSGATFSGNGILEAVTHALQLEYRPEKLIAEASQGDGKKNETESEATLVSRESTESSTAPIENETVSGESTPELSAAESSESAESSLADGVYQGSGMGLRGKTEVSVTVKDGRIVDITVDSYADDDKYFNRAKTTVIDSILASQSVEVDTVSGAPFSSNSIIEAVADALGIIF